MRILRQEVRPRKRCCRQGLIAAVLAVLPLAGAAWAKTHSVQDAAGLQALLASDALKGGDRVELAAANYGAVALNGVRFQPPLTLSAQPGTRPVLSALEVTQSAGLAFEGLTIRAPNGRRDRTWLVEVRASENVTLDRLIVETTRDASRWSRKNWVDRAASGVRLGGRNLTLRNSLIRNIRFGVTSRADGARVEGNTIETFSGDGIRALGHNSVYSGNTIDTCVEVDDNHDDGIQSWSVDEAGRPGRGVVRNVEISGNLIRNGDHRHHCTLQGIGLFDGFFEDWTIRGNTVIVDHWHGITVMGGRRVRINENVVVDSRKGKPGAPWISITAHKDGRTSERSRVEGNVTQPWAGGGNRQFDRPQPGVTWARNRTVDTPREALSGR